MAYKPLVYLFIISLNMILIHKAFDHPQDLPVFLHSQETILLGNDLVGPSRKKTGHRPPVLIPAKRKLTLIAVPPWILHAHDRQKFRISPLLIPTIPAFLSRSQSPFLWAITNPPQVLNLSDPRQIMKHLILLKP